MSEEPLDKGETYARGRLPEYFYVSSHFPHADDEDLPNPRMMRFASQVFDSNGEVICTTQDNWRVVLRETKSRQQIQALYFEDSRRIASLAFQRFSSSGKRMNRESFTLYGDEVLDLAAFLSMVMSPDVKFDHGEQRKRLSRSVVAKMLQDQATKRELLEQNREELFDLIRNDESAPEVIALARRKKQLEVFRRLLDDPEFFDERKGFVTTGPEGVWQEFFEQNRWIFGSGLTTQFLHSWNPERLQESVVGASIKQAGKRPDGLMRTAGVMSSMVLVEIKTHLAPLLAANEYRSGVFAPSSQLAGSVAQCQATLDAAMENLGPAFQLVDSGGFSTEEVVRLCRPRSLLVAGSLDEFTRDGQVHEGQFRSFERYRRSISDPEIVTFDELYDRMRLVLAADEPEASDETESEPPPFEGGF